MINIKNLECQNYECQNIIGIMCLKKLMLTKRLVRMSVLFVIIGAFFRLILDFRKKYMMVVRI